jgi:hypothetical protein
MKALKILLIIFLLTIPVIVSAQTEDSGKRSSQSETYHRKTRKARVSTGTSSDSLTKETGPILNDNGTINTTGTVEGSRSSTGRPDVDSTVSYTVKRKKKTVIVEGSVPADASKNKKKP